MSKSKIIIRKKELKEVIILNLISDIKYNDISNYNENDKMKLYIKIINTLDDKYKKYCVIKPSYIFMEIKKQTVCLLNNGFNIVFELLNIYDDFVVYYSPQDTNIIQGNSIKKWVCKYNSILEKANNNELKKITVYNSVTNIKEVYPTKIENKKDISIIDIILSSIYYDELNPILEKNNYKYAIIRDYLNIPDDFPKFNIKCAFIGDYVFDKIKGYEDSIKNLNITSKVSIENILL